MFNQGDLITASGLNAVNSGTGRLPELDAAWWPGGSVVSTVTGSVSPSSCSGRLCRHTHYNRDGAWHAFPNDNGIYIHGHAWATFHYYYQKNIFTNGGDCDTSIEQWEDGGWHEIYRVEHSNQNDYHWWLADINGPGLFRIWIWCENTSWDSYGDVGVIPWMDNCAPGDWLYSAGSLLAGNVVNHGRPLTAAELNSGRVFTSHEVLID